MAITRKTYKAVSDAVREGWIDVFGQADPDTVPRVALLLQERIVQRLVDHPDFGVGANPSFDEDRFRLAADGPHKARVLRSVNGDLAKVQQSS